MAEGDSPEEERPGSMAGEGSCRVKPSLEPQFSLHLASGLVLHTLPTVANRHSWVGGEEPLAQSSSLPPGSGPAGGLSSFLLQFRQLGRNRCPRVPLPFSSSYLEEET